MVDGPWGGHKGSWLLSGRSSYADYLQRAIEKITGTGRYGEDPDDSNTDLNFSDAQVKGAYSLSPQHQVGISATYGILTADQKLAPGTADLEQLKWLESQNLLVSAFWRYTPHPHFTLQTKAFGIADEMRDKNRNEGLLDDIRRRQAGFRSDATWIAGPQTIEAGAYVRFVNQRRRTNSYKAAQPLLPLPLENFDEHGKEDSYYLQDTWRGKRASLTLGGRLAHSDVTGQTVASPRGSFTWAPFENWTMRAGAGSYAQFPRFEQIFGYFGNRRLRAEQAVHYNFSIERRIGVRTRVIAEAYDREDRNQAFAFVEPVLVNGQGVAYGMPYQNVVRGHARGVELTVQRRSANGLTGWVTYGYGATKYRDSQDHLEFAGDFDQRHSLTAVGSYRLRPTVDVSAQWRYGSGVPVPGFVQLIGTNLSLASARNTTRLPPYERLDLRANKAFLFTKWKLTLSAEVLNVLARVNYIVITTDPLRIYSAGRFAAGLDTSFGVLPSLAVAISF